jgi:branched-chain amino acid transport system substrate-binding protein
VCAVSLLVLSGALVACTDPPRASEPPGRTAAAPPVAPPAPAGGWRPSATWRVGMLAPFTGAAQELGDNMRRGAEAYFAIANQAGGVAGHPLELVARNDANEPSKTGPALHALIEEEHVFALLGNVGTSTAAVSVPIVTANKTPLFGAMSGARLLRKTPPDRYVVNVRASYDEEMEEIIRGLTEELHVSAAQIGFFTQDDSYGDAGWDGAVAALERRGTLNPALLARGRYARNTLDVEGAVSALTEPGVELRAVVMVGFPRPCARFVRLARAHGLARAVFVHVSIGSDELARELGDDGEGLIATEVVPFPEGDAPAAREFQAVVPAAQRNHTSLEAFVVARAFVTGLRLAGPAPTPETFLSALAAQTSIDLGLGIPQPRAPADHQLSHHVWLTVLRHGKLAPLEAWRRGAKS